VRHSFVERKLDVFSLITVGTGMAWVHSIVAMLAPGLFRRLFADYEGTVAVYFEAAAGIAVLVPLGQVPERVVAACTCLWEPEVGNCLR
jgi:P-type Cu+ transporter